MDKKKFKAVELKHLDQETILKIREWRNQDFVRLQSLTQDVIDEETHLKWIERMKSDKNRYLFVSYLDDEPLGVIQLHYDPDEDVVESGEYLVSEEMQACGYGTILQFYEGVIIYEILHFSRGYGVVLTTNQKNVRMQKRNSTVLVEKTEMPVGNGHKEVMKVGQTREEYLRKKEKVERLVNRFVDPQIEVVL